MTQNAKATDWGSVEFRALNDTCDSKKFDCGRSEINDWFRKKALKHQGNLRCRVQTCHLPGNNCPASFYALQMGFDEAGKLDRMQRDQIGRDHFPAIDLMYIAVQRPFQSQGLGRHSLMNALEACYRISEYVPFYAVTLTAIDKEVVPFYEKLGFRIYDKEDTDRPRMLLPAQSIIDLFSA